MRLKLLLLCSFLGAVVQGTPYKQDYKCTHDGYSNPDGKCVCTKNDLMNFYSGSTCANIQCMNTGVVDQVGDSEPRCVCPPGFLGTHCEPVQCVAGEVKSFNEATHGRDVSVIITYNKEFQEQVKNKDKTNDLPKVLCDSIKSIISENDGVTPDSKIRVWLMETDVIIDDLNTCADDINGNVNVLCSDVPDGKGGSGTVKSCEGDLTSSYINEALADLGEDSRLIILSNEGIVDENPENNLEAIRKKAISLRIQIHSIVLSPRKVENNNIYFNGPFQLLRELSESTLGFFITPFDASGMKIGPDGIVSTLQTMMGVFFEYVVIDRITTNKTSCTLPTDYTVFRTMEPNPQFDFWMTVASSGANYYDFNTAWIGAPTEPTREVYAGFFNAYTLPATEGQVVTLKPYSTLNQGGKCVPSTVMILAKSYHLARFAITNEDDIDASSPFAVNGTKNTLVGHFVKHFHEEHLKMLHLDYGTDDGFSMRLENNPTPRDCQYNAKFGEVSCDAGANTLIRVRDKESGAAVTVQSLYCSPKEKSSAVSMLRSEVAVAPTEECNSPDFEVKKDGRSLIVAAHATDNIYKLFNGNSKSAIRYLNDLADSGHYSNYISNIYNKKTATDANNAGSEYDDFKNNLMTSWSKYRDGSGDDGFDTCEKPGPIEAIVPLEDVAFASNPLPNSDIIFIYDRAYDADLSNDEKLQDLRDLQKRMYQKRLRLIVLLLGCKSDFGGGESLRTWNRIAAATGGFAVYFEKPEELNDFLASYVNWVEGETAASNDVNFGSMGFSWDPASSTPFQVKSGNSYTILVNSNPAVQSLNISKAGVVINSLSPSAQLGNSMAVFEYTAEEDTTLTVIAPPSFYFYYGAIRVLDFDGNFATIGFTEKICLDQAYPDMNPKHPQYPATVAVAEAKVTMTLFDSKGSAFRTGEVAETDGTNYHLEYNWKCSDNQNLYYITSDITADGSSFTRVITSQCFGSGKEEDKCINGEYNTDKTGCDCPHQYKGETCDIPICQNGGILTAALECDCTATDGYEGEFCQIYIKCDDTSSAVPQFKSLPNTVIFLIERSAFVTERLGNLGRNMFSSYRTAQYVVARYVNGTNFDLLLSTTDKDLVYDVIMGIEAVDKNSDGEDVDVTFEATTAFKAAIQAQTTDSSLLFWFAQEDSIEDFVTDLFEPIALKRVSISAFVGNSLIDTPIHPITLAGGSLFYIDDDPHAYATLFTQYIAPLLKYSGKFENRPNSLSISTECIAKHTINVDQYTSKLFVAADKGKVSIQPVVTPISLPGGEVFPISAGGQYIISITNDGNVENCTSSVIALSQSQVAYGYLRHEGSDAFNVATEKGQNVLVSYWTAQDEDATPSATITSLSVDGFGEPTEVFMTLRDKCSYTLSLPINCTGVDAYGVKITNLITPKPNSGPSAYVDKYIPVLCLNGRECENGVEQEDGSCKCDKFWGGDLCDKKLCEKGDINGDVCACYNGYSGENCEDFTPPEERTGKAVLFIQDVCGEDETLKDEAQSVYADYMNLMDLKKNTFYLATNDENLDVLLITSVKELTDQLAANRPAPSSCVASIGPALDKFYSAVQRSSQSLITAVSDSIGSINVAHVTSVSVDDRSGALDELQNYYIVGMTFVGITYKNEFFAGEKSFDQFGGYFTQTYDPEVALIFIHDEFGTDSKFVVPAANNPRCIENLQSAFVFHNDISSVPKASEYRSKAQKIIKSVTNYFTIPDVTIIDNNEDDCSFNKDQEKDKTLFAGSLYANGTGISVPEFCTNNMAAYTDTISKADYKQQSQVTMAGVIAYFTKWYGKQQMMDCNCFDNNNDNSTNFIVWTPLSPTSLDSLDDAKLNFDGFKPGNFNHIVMPFGFKYGESPLWQKLVPDQEMWLKDASKDENTVEQLIQDIWTLVCRTAGRIESTWTAEPYSYTTRGQKTGNDQQGNELFTDEPVTDSDVLP